jgi:hypothetical protein
MDISLAPLVPCDVCMELLGDVTPKVASWCSACQANICAFHQFDFIGRTIAAAKRIAINYDYAGWPIGHDMRCSNYYYVQYGDTWEKIAATYGTTPEQLRLINFGVLQPTTGQRICITLDRSEGDRLRWWSGLAV